MDATNGLFSALFLLRRPRLRTSAKRFYLYSTYSTSLFNDSQRFALQPTNQALGLGKWIAGLRTPLTTWTVGWEEKEGSR